MALTSLAGKRTKTGTEDRANAGLHFSTRKPGYTKTNKPTNISAESAVSTAKSSPKEKRCRKSNLLQHDDRFRFRVNSGFRRKGGPVSFLVLLFYFSSYYLGFGFFSGLLRI